MKPSNSDKRRSPFFFFLLFFVITLGLIMLTTFFGFEVPGKQISKYQTEIEKLNRDKKFFLSFSEKENTVKMLLDTINVITRQEDYEKMSDRLNVSLLDLEGMLKEISPFDQPPYKSIIETLRDLKVGKKKIKDCESHDPSGKVAELQDKYEQSQMMQLQLQSSNDGLRKDLKDSEEKLYECHVKCP